MGESIAAKWVKRLRQSYPITLDNMQCVELANLIEGFVEVSQEVTNAHRNNLEDNREPHPDDPFEMRRWKSLRAMAAIVPPVPKEHDATLQAILAARANTDRITGGE